LKSPLYPAVRRMILRSDGMEYRRVALFVVFCVKSCGRMVLLEEFRRAVEEELNLGRFESIHRLGICRVSIEVRRLVIMVHGCRAARQYG
jgi:hypothetical protein